MIFWFSGTGNSRYVARRIAQALGDREESISKIVQSGRFQVEPAPEERLGIVIPSYYWGIPDIVRTFISQLKITSDTQPYTYVIFTCGGAPCNAIGQVQQFLPVHFTDYVTMPDNFILKYDRKHPQDLQLCLRAAEEKIDEIIKKIRIWEKPKSLSQGPLSVLATKLAYPEYDKKRKTKHFFTDENCNGCGVCAKICPNQVIRMEQSRPTFTSDLCTLCLACIHRCPQNSMQFGAKTAKHKRYVHPDMQDDDPWIK